MSRFIPVTHELKIWPQYFEAVVDGSKTFELRENDRDFQVGDILWLREYEPSSKKITGQSAMRRVTYMVEGPVFGLARGFVVMSIVPHEN